MIRRDWLRGIGLLLFSLAVGVAAICAVYYVMEQLQASEEVRQFQTGPTVTPQHPVVLRPQPDTKQLPAGPHRSVRRQ
jgi:hypothetical protein